MEIKNNQTKLYSVDIERAVLGALIIDNDKWDDVSPLLNEDVFYLQWHKVIFKAIKHNLDAALPVDLIILEQSLKTQDLGFESGLFSYLAEMIKDTPGSANILGYAQAVINYKQLRDLALLGKNLCEQTKASLSKPLVEELIVRSEEQLFKIASKQQPHNSLVNLTDAIGVVLNKIENSYSNNNAISGVPSGIEQIDQMTTGFQNSDFVVIAGRPGMGKTAFALTAIKSALEAYSSPVQFYSLEMPGDQIIMRFISMIAQVPMQLIRNALLMDDESFSKIGESIHFIKTKWEKTNQLLIDDSPDLTPQTLRTRVRKNIRLYGKPSAIFIDYLQLMHYPGTQNRYEEVSKISNSLKKLAKEVQCPVITLAQLNRGVEGRAIKKPTNSDLRDSGAIEQDADLIILLHRDEYYNENNSETKGLAEIIVGKQRNGPVGTVLAKFMGQYSQFKTYSTENRSDKNLDGLKYFE